MNLRKISTIISIFLIIFSTSIFSSCNSSKTAVTTKTGLSGTVTASGSTALLPIVKQAATDFMTSNNNVNVTVSGGGSGTGIQQAKDGVVNIGDSDIVAESNSGLVDHQVAIEPFTFVVNKNVKINSLTKEQLIEIFSGTITNWKDVGGDDTKITLIMRQVSSGTRKTIQSEVMDNKGFTTNGVVQDSNGAVKKTVANTPNSIGYVDFAYVDSSLKAISYNGIAPTIDNVKNGKYMLTSTGHMYTKGEATGATKAFIEYIQSPTFQSNVLPKYQFVSVKK